MEEKLIWLYFAKNYMGSELKKAFKTGEDIWDVYEKNKKDVDLDEMQEYYEKECKERGIEFITMDEAGFPPSLLEIPEAPF